MKRSTFAVVTLALSAAFLAGCSSPEHKRGDRHPDPAQLMEKMDANQDGMLSQDELRGPLSENFTSIDTNSDGFISAEELKNMPKPKRRP